LFCLRVLVPVLVLLLVLLLCLSVLNVFFSADPNFVVISGNFIR
jgi:hypothetical protein